MSDIVAGLRHMNLKMADLAADEITHLRALLERVAENIEGEGRLMTREQERLLAEIKGLLK